METRCLSLAARSQCAWTCKSARRLRSNLEWKEFQIRSAKAPPGGNFSGGDSSAFPYATLAAQGNSRPTWCGTEASFCDCHEEYGGIGVTAAFFSWIRQHEVFMPIPRIGQSCAMARQQSGWPARRAPSRQADAGIVAQKTTTTSIINALFLLRFMVNKSPKAYCKHPFPAHSGR